ncbi:MAG: hypothetical protein ACRCXZ_05550 [Patescibacteria group bacterium]
MRLQNTNNCLASCFSLTNVIIYAKLKLSKFLGFVMSQFQINGAFCTANGYSKIVFDGNDRVVAELNGASGSFTIQSGIVEVSDGESNSLVVSSRTLEEYNQYLQDKQMKPIQMQPMVFGQPMKPLQFDMKPLRFFMVSNDPNESAQIRIL